MALEHVGTARVLDAFCGTGEMWSAVWRQADYYAGCDARDWDFTGPPRFVCNNEILLRSIDLGQFNVFDLDAYGSPWVAAHIIGARRKWGTGERGALVLTDGSSMRTRFGGETRGMGKPVAKNLRASDESERAALRNWIGVAGVEVMAIHRATGNGSGRGQRMTYTAVLFKGQPTSDN